MDFKEGEGIMKHKRSSGTLWGSLFLIVLYASVCAEPSSAATSHVKKIEPSSGKIQKVIPSKKVRSAPVLIQYFGANNSPSGVELVWSAFSDHQVRGFRLYRQADDEAYFGLVNTNGLVPLWQQSYVDIDVMPSTTYYYILSVVMVNGQEYLSQPIKITTDDHVLSSR